MRTLLAYCVVVACLLEVRLPGSGHKEIKAPHANATYHLHHSGVLDNTGRHGVALVVSTAANARLQDWAPISSRLTRIRLKDAVASISIIAIYAPTLDATDDIKGDF